MCKVTRNVHQNAQHAHQQVGQRLLVAKAPLENLSLPSDNANNKQTNVAMQSSCVEEVLVEEMVVELKKTVEQQRKEELPCASSSDSSTAVAHVQAKVGSSVTGAVEKKNVDWRLMALSSLCLPEEPSVVPGPVLRECLLGQVRFGSYALGGNAFLPVVVKEFNLNQVLDKRTKQGQKLHEDALAELEIHAYIQKKKRIKNVIGLYAMHLDMQNNKLSAYLEYATQGELFSVLKARGEAFPLSVAGNFLVQLLQGIADLHAINVVHRDLSLENLLLTQDNQIKICDFGLATICAPGTKINDGRVVGKEKYMCPELYFAEEYDARLVDIWSAGVIFFLMLTSVFPYERPSADDPRLVMVCHGQINEMLAHWKRATLDEEVLQVFSKMFCPPQERWHAEQLLQLPFCQRFANVQKATIANALGQANGYADAISKKKDSFHSDAKSSLDSPASQPLARSEQGLLMQQTSDEIRMEYQSSLVAPA